MDAVSTLLITTSPQKLTSFSEPGTGYRGSGDASRARQAGASEGAGRKLPVLRSPI